MPHQNQSFVKVFKDRHTLYVMISLRRNGVSISSLSEIFGIDKRGIRYQLTRTGVYPTSPVFSLSSILREVTHQPRAVSFPVR